ncbi:uncharacterized protein LAESUDRAFT_723625 [Laetiporus sulphureus 93-53]|uniref:Uncharacterized protein n=1 Tax=Laetiporus sulphureus 93-53 TaxID=1314785 RepID=A0A165FBH5_9APHY|nr:uncharacterized protein LAESUDRAFT_723625 [Laetiporus sulphureus 93-53]KZT08715.1 hypothetical protein LAESUDRAFT_723625 [Laetiporus sulphureus 93-53]
MESQLKAKVTARVDYDRTEPPSPLDMQAGTLSPPNMMRPKAKVNSSAHIVARKAPRGPSPSSATRSSFAPPPLPPFPNKASHPAFTRAPSSTSVVVKARLTHRAGAQRPSTFSADAHQRSLTTIPSDSTLSSRTRQRRGSISSHVSYASHSSAVSHAASSAQFEALGRTQSRGGTVSHEENGSLVPGSGKGVVRVKSKISNPPSPSSITSSPPSFASRNHHGRTPSIPYISLTGSLPASGAASPTFIPARHSIHFDGLAAATKIDPATIPLPPQSPPMSAVSYSSRSSASRSSASYDSRSSDGSNNTAPRPHSHVNGDAQVKTAEYAPMPRASMDNLADITARNPGSPNLPSDTCSDGSNSSGPHDLEDDLDDPDRKRKDEAKSNRKIADLEISNHSLLAINSSLEAAKHRQAKEIRDLKRKLRESLLILPPPVYQAAKSTLPQHITAEEEEDGEDDEEDQAIIDGKDDEPYRRVKLMVESLVESCQRALSSKPSDFVESGKSGTKVLTAEEVRSWRGDMSVDEPDVEVRSTLDADLDDDSSLRGAEESIDDQPRTLDGADLHSNGEVGASSFEAEAAGSSVSLPPITVTPSL